MTYSYNALKTNLEKYMKQRSLRIVDLEEKANKTRIVQNILRGSSTNPTIDTVKSLADALNIDIEDLLSEDSTGEIINTALFLDVCVKTIQEINPLVKQYNIKMSNFIKIVKEAYNYSNDLDLKSADTTFIKWIIRQSYNTK